MEQTWSDIVYERLRAAGVTLVAHVPDSVIADMIRRFETDDAVTTVSCTREEEGVGILAGGLLAGEKGALLMQTSGLGNCPNALGSLIVPYHLPLVMIISGRGEFSEFNAVQRGMGLGALPILAALGISTHVLDRLDTLVPVLDGALTTAYLTSFPVAFVISPLLSGRSVPANEALH